MMRSGRGGYCGGARRVAEGPQELLSKRRASQAALGQGAVGFSEKD